MKNILFVDDEPLIPELVATMLDDPALEVNVEGDTGATIFATLIEAIYPHVRILVMSGRSDDVEITRSHSGWQFTGKPLDVLALSRTVAGMLEH